MRISDWSSDVCSSDLMTGEIPAYYTEADIQNDPRDLHFNLESADFQYFQPSRMRDDPLWRSVTSCFEDDHLNIMKIAAESDKDDADKFALAQKQNGRAHV